MPLDGKIYEAVPDLKVLHKGLLGLRQLSYVLRRPELWSRLTWNFDELLTKLDCGTVGCAIGVAEVVWGRRRGDRWPFYAKRFKMTKYDFNNIFLNDCAYAPVPDDEVTPTMVADRIDEYINSQLIEQKEL